MGYKVVIFDLDGTLLDTAVGIKDSIKNVIEDRALNNIDDKLLDKFIGPPMQLSFEKHLNLNKDDAWQLANKFRDDYIAKNLFNASIYENVENMLEYLKAHDIKLAIATSKREDYTITILEKFNLIKYFDKIKGSDFAGHLSKSDIIKIVIEHFADYNLSEFIMVGDTEFDCVGAMDNKIDFIAVSYGYGYKNDTTYKDIIVVASVDELKNIILGK